MGTITKVIQEQVPLGTHVNFTLRTGEEISGSLTKITQEHVKVNTHTQDVPTENIVGWKILGNKGLESDDVKSNSIQQEIPLGTHVKFSQENGGEASGTLTEIGQEYVTVDTQNGRETVFTEMIDSWTIVDNEGPEEDESGDTRETPRDSLSPEGPEKSLEEPGDTTVLEKLAPAPTNLLNQEVIEALNDIQARFNAQQQNAEIELYPLNFTYPKDELIGWENTDVPGAWVAIKNQYDNAKKMNELVNPKFGRIQRIISELKSLTERIPESPSLKQTLAYFYSISNNWDEALQNYQKAAIQSEDANDWFDVAVSALKLNKKELACYRLEKFFYKASISDEPKAWYVYVNLLEKFNNLPAFCKLCKTDEYSIADEGIEVLLDTAIYLLQKKGEEALATGITQKRLTNESAKSLLGEVCQKFDGEEPAESYRQFLTVMEDRIREEKKQASITPQPHKHNPPKRKKRTSSGKKRKTQRQVGPENPLYTRAKRASDSNDLDQAERLYQEVIDQGKGNRIEPAIKDLASVLVRLERVEEAIRLLEENRHRATDKQAWDNLQISVYQKDGQHENAIRLLNNILKDTKDQERKANILLQIAIANMKLENDETAEDQFRKVLKLRPFNITVKRNLALCLSRQGRYNEAEQILNEIQNTSPDAKTVELLEAIRARGTGAFVLDEDSIIEIETEFSDFSSDLSGFARFFLDRCTFEGIPDRHKNDGKYTGDQEAVKSDIKNLNELINNSQTAQERSNYCLAAARIYSDVGNDPNSFYQYLYRSFVFKGDAAASANNNLDTVREWYREALTVYDRIYKGRLSPELENEEDAGKEALVKCLYSILSHGDIPLNPNGQTTLIGTAVDAVAKHTRNFDAIAYLVLYSRYAANMVLGRLNNFESLRPKALNYLNNMSITNSPTIEVGPHQFMKLWDKLRSTLFDNALTISSDLANLKNFEFSKSWLERNIKNTEDIRSNLFIELDKQRVTTLGRILKGALEFYEATQFEKRVDTGQGLKNSCQTLLSEIEGSPTKLSVEDVYRIIESIQEKVNAEFEKLFTSSKPDLTLRLAKGNQESYVPDDREIIEVQIVVENREGRMPAESLELVITENTAYFEVEGGDIKRNELRGGEKPILSASLRLTPGALQPQEFFLTVSAQYEYRTHSREKIRTATDIENFSIRLSSKEKFKNIDNRYAPYAEGTVVGDDMFFGRDEEIQNVAHAIETSSEQSKCVLIFGQFRSGKSSVLHHLKKRRLEKNKDLLILDLGDIRTHMDANSKVSLQYQILRSILHQLESAIKNRVEQFNKDGFNLLDLPIPNAEEFYAHPTPLQYFGEIIEKLNDLVFNQADWHGVRVVLLIDEFQDIYNKIVAGQLPETFMQTWRGLLHTNRFNAVLVGQDVMSKFKDRFPDAFNAMQDVRVTYLKDSEAIDLIQNPIRIGGDYGESRYREQAIQRILDLTAGSPFYIQIICSRLVNYMNLKSISRVTQADVEQVKNGLIKGSTAFGRDKFDNLLQSGDTSGKAIPREDARKVLKVIADYSSVDPCPRNHIDCETSLTTDGLTTDEILEDLVTREVVGRDQVGRDQDAYYIRVGLYKEWLVVNG